jgi:hypothetical protein
VTAVALKKFRRPTALAERRYRTLAEIFAKSWSGLKNYNSPKTGWTSDCTRRNFASNESR